jgi:hypothetical protein
MRRVHVLILVVVVVVVVLVALGWVATGGSSLNLEPAASVAAGR